MYIALTPGIIATIEALAGLTWVQLVGLIAAAIGIGTALGWLAAYICRPFLRRLDEDVDVAEWGRIGGLTLDVLQQGLLR